MEINLDHIQIIIRRTKTKIFKIIAATAIIAAMIFIALFGLVSANKGKLVRGLKIADISIGGLTTIEAQTKLDNLIAEYFKKDIVLKYKQEIWTALPGEMGIKINTNSSINKAFEIGHLENLLPNLAQQILAFLGYYNLPLASGINEIELENFIREELNSIDNPAVNAGWRYDKQLDKFVQIPSQKGTIIDRKNFKLQLLAKIEKLSKDDIYLNLVDDYPEIVEEETIEAYNKAKQILENAPYKLIPVQVLLTKEELIPMIEFQGRDVSFNKQSLKNYLITLSSSINKNPVDAQFTIEGDRVTEFRLSQNGLKLEIEKNIKKLDEEISAGKKEIELEISVVPPKIATENINNLGVTSFLGKGVSNFGGSPSNRIHNIKIGAAKFQGVLIKPGEEFSFNTILGEIGPKQGYKAELVIKKNKTIPEYGGGLCQVSTTAFRAAINSGLKITERFPHSFPVVYYNPQGFDATIYPPHPDLRFINDTPGHLLIQTKVEDNDLIFEFYGTNDGRKVEIEGPFQYDLKSNGSMKAKLTRKIYKNNELVEEKTWYSNYKSPSLYPVRRNPLE